MDTAMHRQVVSVSPDGVITGLQRKAGQGFSLKDMGRAKVERISDIKWHEGSQKYYVQFLEPAGPHADKVVTSEMIKLAVSRCAITALCDHDTLPGFKGALFEEYDDAVAAEILVLDDLRLMDPMAFHAKAS